MSIRFDTQIKEATDFYDQKYPNLEKDVESIPSTLEKWNKKDVQYSKEELKIYKQIFITDVSVANEVVEKLKTTLSTCKKTLNSDTITTLKALRSHDEVTGLLKEEQDNDAACKKLEELIAKVASLSNRISEKAHEAGLRMEMLTFRDKEHYMPYQITAEFRFKTTLSYLQAALKEL